MSINAHRGVRHSPRRNFSSVTVGALTLWFSYQTAVAFRHPDVESGRLIVRENDWGPTTGRHLNAVDGGSPAARKLRLSGIEFIRRLGAVWP